ncbi:hypothetical protein GJ496_007471 [Pomphorhynchus laevis]|nr:hypothetical protein GJ496_007471 [Pomphorhynchus laevis]
MVINDAIKLEVISDHNMPSSIESIELGKDTLLSKFNASHLIRGKDFDEVFFDSPYGQIQVLIQGKKKCTPFVTFHDLGLNGFVQYTGFFASEEMEKIMEHFCVYHITAPGQHENAKTIAHDAKYPTMDEMADIIDYAIGYFKQVIVIGIGIGMGGHIMAEAALFYPNRFIAIITINCITSVCGWAEWANTKLMKFHLRHNTVDATVINSLLYHHIGNEVMQSKPDLAKMYYEYFATNLHAVNFQRLLDSFVNRTALNIERDTENSSTIECSVMNVVGDYSPHLDEAVEFNGQLNPKTSTFVKLSECGGLVLDEQPDKFAESLMYFLQGLGYVCNLNVSKESLSSRLHHKIMGERITSQYSRARSKTTMLNPTQSSMSFSQQGIPKEV